MESLSETVAALPDRYPKTRRYLIGVSGGLDSVVLLRLLTEAGYDRLTVCHLDHRLRGRQSTGDAAFVKRLAARLGHGFVGARTDVAEEAAREKQSLETAGRMARRRFFLETARALRCPRLLLAHHADDQVETVLMNLCRGGAGLKGMEQSARLTVPGVPGALAVFRPLLEVRRGELSACAAGRGWRYREDPSNTSPEHTRNRVRHELMPLLADIFRRDPAPAIHRAAASSAEAAAFLRAAARPFADGETLDARALASQPPAVRLEAVFLWLNARGVRGIDHSHVTAAERLLRPSTGPAKCNLPGNSHIRRRAGRIWLEG